MKFLLALLALLTGFSVTDGVRLTEPAMAQGNGVVRDSQLLSEESQIAASASVFKVVALLPMILTLRPSQHRLLACATRVVPPTVHRSDRLRQ